MRISRKYDILSVLIVCITVIVVACILAQVGILTVKSRNDMRLIPSEYVECFENDNYVKGLAEHISSLDALAKAKAEYYVECINSYR